MNPSLYATVAIQKQLAHYPQSEYSCLVKSNSAVTLVETQFFVKKAAALWSDAELDDLKDFVACNPLAGDEIPGTGGLRKLRWRRAGMGKRGGARVIYYYYDESAPLYLLMAYSKAAQENPSPAAVATLAKLAEAVKTAIKAKKKEKGL
jgi:RelE toxin of RelE / RelB toxin-antitoxin system